MIMLEIVVKIAHQIKPLLYRYSKGLLCYAFFDALCHYQNQKPAILYVGILHNADYVLAAVFGGYFYIINRIFSMRRRCSVPVEMI